MDAIIGTGLISKREHEIIAVYNQKITMSDGIDLDVDLFGGFDIVDHDAQFIDTVEKARKARDEINLAYAKQGERPLVFSTLINPETRKVIIASNGFVMDLFEMFILPLEETWRLGETVNGPEAV